MNYQRFSYNYQIPYQPLYERARQELEQGITILQEKIKLKKQLQVQRQLQQKLLRIGEMEDNLKHDRALQEIAIKQQLQHSYSNQQLKLPLNSSREQFRQQIRDKGDMNSSGKKQAERMQPIKIQEVSHVSTPQKQRMETIPQKSAEKSSMSISSNTAQPLPPNIGNSILPQIPENEENFITHRENKDVQKFHLYETPIHLLGRASNSKKKPIKPSELASPVKEQTEQAKQFIRTEYTPSKSRQLLSTFTQGDFSTLKPISKLNRSKSLKQKKLSKPVLTSSAKKQQLSSNKKIPVTGNIMASLKQSALQRVKSRIKVSSIYADAHFSNSKHEITRLFSTFESQLASRTQIILKICKAQHSKRPSN